MSHSSAGQDLVAATILRSKLEAIVAEMEAVLLNTAYSSNVSVSRQCAAALITEQGEIVAVSSAAYVYPLAFTSAAVIDQYQYNLSGEDVLLTNDPYGGGTRVQNFTAIAPVSDGETIALYVAVCAQTEDFAGDIRGNLNPAATEVWAEGARCPPVKIVREGRPQRDVLKTLALNSRNPVAFELDVQAMLAACNVGRRRLGELMDRHGRADLVGMIAHILDYSERRVRALLAQVRSGPYRGEYALEHDAQGRGDAVVKVELRFGESAVDVDFTGTSPQSTSFVNATRAAAATSAFLPLVAAFAGQVPFNAGALRPIRLVLPEGTLVNPRSPAPTGWGEQHAGHEIASAVTLALAEAMPDQAARVTANSILLFSTHRLARHGQTLEQVETFDLSQFVQGGTDGTSERDGWGMPGAAARVPLPSVELYEAERGGRVESIEYAMDSAGAGARRGSPGTTAVVAMPHIERGSLHLTAAVLKGKPSGQSNRVVLQSFGEALDIDTVAVNRPLEAGARIALTMEGGLGHGDPLDRDPACVARDVLDEVVSPQAARDVYGVVLDPRTGAVDDGATRRRRTDLRSANARQRENVHG